MRVPFSPVISLVLVAVAQDTPSVAGGVSRPPSLMGYCASNMAPDSGKQPSGKARIVGTSAGGDSSRDDVGGGGQDTEGSIIR